jgi:PKD repeat protein
MKEKANTKRLVGKSFLLFSLTFAAIIFCIAVMPGCKRSKYYMTYDTGTGSGGDVQDLPDVPVDGPPTAAFYPDKTVAPAIATVQFTDDSQGNIETWAWDFGDGHVSTEANPTHVYELPGKYSVSLKVSGPGGVDQLDCNNCITVKAPEVDLDPAGFELLGLRFERGKEFDFSVIVRNDGPDSLSQFKISVFLASGFSISESDPLVAQCFAEGIGGDQETEVFMIGNMPETAPVGPYILLARVEAPEYAVEHNTSNNDSMPDTVVMVYRKARLEPTADTFVHNGSPDAAMGALPFLSTEYVNGGATHSQIHMMFDLDNAQLEEDAYVSNARLNLYAMSTTGESSKCLEVYPVTESWLENCTWNDAPRCGPDPMAFASVPNLGWTVVDVTDLAKSWSDGEIQNYGMTLYTWTPGTAYSFFSREHGPSQLRPYLEIEIDRDIR